MKTSLLLAALLSLGAAAAFAADAPAANPPAAPAATDNPNQKKCDQLDADLTKLYASHKGFLITFKAHGLLNQRKHLKCPGNPPAAPGKK